ncbi:MAG: tRNA (adenosine(37)-N6)-threonylcarbamoyltransferase complex dimerization subunit type 1 TsaB [Bacteroidota bacterium]
MTVLGIETSTSVCSVGLVSGERTFHRALREDRIHSEKLLTLVDEVLREAGRPVEELDGVAVARGPGSFTGLRIGVSAAKGLVMAGRAALIGVPTMDAAVRGARAAGLFPDGGVVLMDARQGDWYVGVYDGSGAAVHTAVEPHAAALARCEGRAVMTDRPESVRSLASVVLDLHDHVRGDVVAVVGHERLRLGQQDDVATFEPVYLKEFVIRSAVRRPVV